MDMDTTQYIAAIEIGSSKPWAQLHRSVPTDKSTFWASKASLRSTSCAMAASKT